MSWTCSGACAFTNANAVSIESASISTARLSAGSSAATASSSPASVETSTDCAPGPCSSCATRSHASGSAGAVESATHDELARPGQGLDPDLAEQPPLGLLDVRVPRPATRSTRGIRSVPSASAATAWAPPTAYTSSTPSRPQAARAVGCGRPSGPGGEHTAIPGTPATWAGTIAITALDGYVARPPGTYRPARRTGTGRLETTCPAAASPGWGAASAPPRRCGRWSASSSSASRTGGARPATAACDRGGRDARLGDVDAVQAQGQAAHRLLAAVAHHLDDVGHRCGHVLTARDDGRSVRTAPATSAGVSRNRSTVRGIVAATHRRRRTSRPRRVSPRRARCARRARAAARRCARSRGRSRRRCRSCSSPSAHRLAISIAMPARMSGLAMRSPYSRAGPVTTDAVRVAQDDPRAHRHQLVGEDQAVLEHLLEDQHGAGGLGGDGHRDRRQVGREHRPRPVLDLRDLGVHVVDDAQRLAGRDAHASAVHLDRDPEPRERVPDRAQVLDRGILDHDLAAGDRGQPDERGHLDVVGADPVARSRRATRRRGS